MNLILLLFVYPLVVVVSSIALQIVLERPWLVASIVFAVTLLIVTLISTPEYIVLAVAYAVLALIVAYITDWFINKRDMICCVRTARSNNNMNCCNRRMFQ